MHEPLNNRKLPTHLLQNTGTYGITKQTKAKYKNIKA